MNERVDPNVEIDNVPGSGTTDNDAGWDSTNHVLHTTYENIQVSGGNVQLGHIVNDYQGLIISKPNNGNHKLYN